MCVHVLVSVSILLKALSFFTYIRFSIAAAAFVALDMLSEV